MTKCAGVDAVLPCDCLQLQIPAVFSSGGSRHSLLAYQAPKQQQPGQLSASSSFRSRSGAGAASEDAAGAADSASLLLAPAQKPAGPNKKFLEKYGLQKAQGLFAP
jgi:hypothetical protein